MGIAIRPDQQGHGVCIKPKAEVGLVVGSETLADKSAGHQVRLVWSNNISPRGDSGHTQASLLPLAAAGGSALR